MVVAELQAAQAVPTTLEQLRAQVLALCGRSRRAQVPQAPPPLGLTAPLPAARSLTRPPAPQAAAFQELLVLEALPQTGLEAGAAARQLAAMVAPAASPAPLLAQLVSQHLGGLPPAKARFVDVSTGEWESWGWGCIACYWPVLMARPLPPCAAAQSQQPATPPPTAHRPAPALPGVGRRQSRHRAAAARRGGVRRGVAAGGRPPGGARLPLPGA